MLITDLKYYPLVYQLALIYSNGNYGDTTLNGAFMWGQTTEGSSFWARVSIGYLPKTEQELFSVVDTNYIKPF